MVNHARGKGPEILPDVATSLTGLSDKTVFLALVLVATVFPLVFVAFVAPGGTEFGPVLGDVFRILAVASTMHVALTGFFYIDPEYRAHIMARKTYYIAIPIAVILTAGLVTTMISEMGIVYLMLFYHAWLLFHYGRQNYGILSFTGAATKSGRALRSERIALHLAPLGGIFAAHAVLAEFGDSVFAPYVAQSMIVGVVLMVGALAAAAWAVIHHLRARSHPWRIVMLVVLASFYLPTFFFDNYTQAVLSYAYAHALQYFIFMYFIAMGGKATNPARSLLALMVVGLLGWVLLIAGYSSSLWGPFQNFIVGAVLGLIMCHFIADARLWRLSSEWQRGRVRERFHFLFKD